MRLKCIKLAGFKSFVDPTTVNFPSNLCAIVGPNGCGKSNIIDAVRWVMGESSAKNLRGESMSDVIFNGSNSRKPLGQASIELVFDNTETTLTGDLAKYAEISIRRKVIRDGTSHYYLNGTKCRRRDITDIFLGTGLGPRSYAIIEQGMISRLIDAKPEELRVYVEEAAGISKYKERRRETENRMRHTKENLERLSDIRDELERQLATLKRQSEAAVKYKEFKKEERLVKAQVQAMQWAELDESSAEQRHQIGENEVALEASITRQREIDTSIEKSRTAHQESTDAFNGVQARYYSLGADIARIEQTIQHQQERYKQLTGDLEQTRSSVTELDNSLRHDKDKLEQYQEELLEVEPMLEELEAMEEQTAIALEEAEVAMQEWQGQWDEFNGESSKATREAEVQQSRIQHIDRSRESLQQRINRLEAEAPNLAGDSDENDLVQLTAQLAEAELRSEQLEDSSRGLSAEVEQCRNNLHESSEDLNRVRSDVQRLRGKQSSLEALQQAARGGKGEGSGRWLAAQGLDNVARLGENLQVESGWETAVETVLGNYLQAVSLDDWAVLNDSGLDFDSGSLTLLSPADSAVASSGQAGLLSKVSAKTDIDLESLLHGVGFADTLSDALARRAQLAAGESIVTRDGIWLGRSWLRVARDSDAQAGIIRRQAELEEVEAGLAQAQEQEEQLQQQVAEWRETLQQQERDLANQQRELGECARSLGDFRAQIGSKRARLEEFARRRERNAAELVEHREQFGIESEQLAEARETLQLALDEMEANDHRRNELLGSRDQLRQSLDSARSSVRQHKDQHHQQALRCQSLKSQIIAAQEAISRMSAQAEQLRTRQLALEESLSETEDPMNISTASLDELLEKRLLVEEELGESRRTLEQVEAEMRQLEEQRVDAENKTQDLRGKLERLRLETQTIRVKQEGLIEQLRESQHDLQGVLGTLTEENTLQERQELLELIGRRIQRLGAINLAAIEEYQQQLERKTYLDAQNDELEEALETLENAIRKIDRETRTRFKDTFDQINKGLGELFPKVFGGGHAYLELTGEDLLDTGVAIMARPPGKRNSTIHLLSGGEKALTAIALVFSIFQLTPAPFCMLDEVDAPLDDANVGRYARMVEEMSAKIQFIYITHNKIAMEMAKQLMGVTMHEPGASRLVSVDVDQAAEMVAV